MAEKEVSLPGSVIPITQKADQTTEQKATASLSQADVIRQLVNKPQDEIMPWENITLPSQGLYYKNAIPGGNVKVRPMGLATDKILATQRLAQTGQALDEVYKRCVNLPEGFDPLDLLVGDRVFILFVLRGITHGNLYEFMIKCPNEACGASSTHTYDLNQTSLTVKSPIHPSEPVRVVLPHYSKIAGREVWVDIRFVRGRDTQIMSQKKKFVEKAVGQSARPRSQDEHKNNSVISRSMIIDQTLEENLNLLIMSANGVEDRNVIAQFVTKMHGMDTATIRRVIRDEAPGLETEIRVTCPECSLDIDMELPITDTFFRPKNSGGVRE